MLSVTAVGRKSQFTFSVIFGFDQRCSVAFGATFGFSQKWNLRIWLTSNYTALTGGHTDNFSNILIDGEFLAGYRFFTKGRSRSLMCFSSAGLVCVYNV